MTRDEAIEAGARALFIHDTRALVPEEAHRAESVWALVGGGEQGDNFRSGAAAVLDAIGWVEPVGYLAPGVTALINAYPTLEEARASGWGGDMYALVPVEGGS